MARILVIEDTPANMTLVATVLEKSAHVVLQAERAPEGIEIARRERPDLVLMGYPDARHGRPGGEQILLEARIIAVADVVEAMASHRPYRPALGIDAALAEIERGKGTALDAAAVDACLKLFRDGRFAFEA